MKTIKINPLNIETTAGTQARVSIKQSMVDEYAQAMKNGDPLPDPVVFAEKGSKRYILADGFHTRLAWMETFKDKPIACELREGTIWDAKIYAAGANHAHGVRRRDKDIQNAVRMLLLDGHSEGSANTIIAGYAKCDQRTVAKVREKMIVKGELDAEKSQKRTHKQGGKDVERRVPPKKDKPAAKDKAKAKDVPAPAKTQDEFDREAIVEAIRVLASAVCPGAEALLRYKLEDQLDTAELAANWLDEMLAASDEKAALTSDDEAFLKVS